MKRFLTLLGIAAVGIAAIFAGSRTPERIRFNESRSSVMIVNMTKNSGGSGVILTSQRDKSFILTNKHICRILPAGGLVVDFYTQEYKVDSFVESNLHDLCLVRVNADLSVTTKLASEPPVPSLSFARIVGHPHLRPTTITEGYFSKHMLVSIMTGSRACTPEEASGKKGVGLGLTCAFLHKMPIVQTRDAVSVSAMIQPGSSGSPVFNEDGEIAALVFASDAKDGNASFTSAVPLEDIRAFLIEGVGTASRVHPDPNSISEGSTESVAEEVIRRCKNPSSKKTEWICTNLENHRLNF